MALLSRHATEHATELSHGIDCACYYRRNVFVSSPVRAHFDYADERQLEAEYAPLLQTLTPAEREELRQRVHAEVRRRRGAAHAAEARKCAIGAAYAPAHPELWSLRREFLHPDFVAMTTGGGGGAAAAVAEVADGVHALPVLSARFCEKLCAVYNRMLT